jgi:hypothetical protein
MGFPSALTATQLDVQRTGQFWYNMYLLFWDQEIIFQAQLNQATYADSFAQLTYDNVTVGAYTDIKADFICYLSSTAGNILTPDHVFRIRADGSGTVATSSTININETSASLTDDWYIMVVKDVRCEAKLPRTITGATPAANSYPRDYAITYRRLLPIIYGLQSFYVGKLNADGYVDFEWAASVLITDNDASADTTLWDIDGLAFQSGTSADLSITARATAAGQYMPRIKHTDDAGNVGYFTFRVKVVPANCSSEVNLAVTRPQITRDLANGHTLRMSADAVLRTDLITRIDQYPDETCVAVWFDTNQPKVLDNIAFVGWLTSENIENTFGSDRNTLLATQFTVEGIQGRFADVISRRLPMTDDSTPSNFGEIEDLTPWRAVAYFLTEHTTLPNIASIVFDDTSEDYRYPRFGSTDSSAIDSVTSLLYTLNAGIDCAPTGEIGLNRDALHLPSADRNSLTTVADWTTTDIAIGSNGGLLFSVQRPHTQNVGRVMAGGGYYNSTTDSIQVLRAITPAVAQSRGNQLVTYNRQILPTDSAINDAADELGQRAADEQAARQPATILRVTHPPALWWMTPHRAQWHTWTIAATDNNRNISYDSNTRWILRTVTVSFDMQRGLPIPTAEYQKETTGGSYQTLVTAPLDGEVQYFQPVLPLAPTYAEYPEDPTSSYADPANITEDDEPPFDGVDQQIVSLPQDPSITAAQTYSDGKTGMCWDGTHLWEVRNIPGNPVYTDYTPADALTTITNGKYDPFRLNGPRALAISNDGTDSRVHITKAFGQLRWTYTDVTGNPFTTILPTRVVDKVYLHTSESTWVLRDTFSVNSGSSSYQGGSYSLTLGTEYVMRVTGSCQYSGTRYGDGQWTTTDWEDPDELTRSNRMDFEIDGRIDAISSTYNSDHIYDFSQTGTGAVHKLRFWDTAYGDNSGTFTVQVFEVIEGYAAATAFSDDFADSFETSIYVGELSGNADADIKYTSAATTIFVPIDDSIEEATNGGAYSSEADGDTTGSYASSIKGFTGTGNAYVYGTAAAVGGETLWIVDDGAKTAITPNDGSNDGVVVGPFAIGMHITKDQHIFVLADFGGTVKLAYSADQGATWQFNTQISNDADYIFVKLITGYLNVYICDGSSLWWGQWDGDDSNTITLYEKGTPSADLSGIVIR